MDERWLYVTHWDDLAMCRARMEIDGYEPYNATDRAAVQLTGDRVSVVSSRSIQPEADGWLNLNEYDGLVAFMTARPAKAQELRAKHVGDTAALRAHLAELQST